ncbi:MULTISPECIES: HdeD family acid-resistance protein [unclassified Streptomyces]|uniref:HdeD family acid-resistance protein n=1 Tax=unclassified Streptomyces TaxID=2593676 RepID=UPI00225C0646|nr:MULTISPECIES: HdeD family acid-resistance protein [unclassified Streptomyces]MCX4529002.1 HdeD family acid-resistance protein [Streptomyces sp. NBC_01551]MCX4540315.1 HdeD family acid-resistance protein [Streptomyces sp. NBC_01565]
MGADRTRREEQQEKKKLSRKFGLLALLGVLLVLAGLVGLVYTGLATLTSMFLFGWLLLIGGVVGLVQAFQSRKSDYFWLAVIVAALNLAAGFVILRRPEASAEALTMFAALLFLVGGVFRLVGALVVRGSNFGLTLVQGAFGILLGLLILSNWPGNSLYVIGTFFSLALLFDGLALIALGMGARRILGLVREDEVSPASGGLDGAREAAEKRAPEDQERSNS